MRRTLFIFLISLCFISADKKTITRALLLEGDSISANPYTWENCMYYNTSAFDYKGSIAQGGGGINEMTIRAQPGGLREQRYTPGADNYLYILIGANDAAGGATPTEYKALIKNYCLDARAHGWKIILATILPRISQFPDWNVTREQINDLYRNDNSFWDYLVDYTTVPIGQNGAEFNTAWYGDGTHPTHPVGYTEMAKALNPVLTAIVSGENPLILKGKWVIH